MTDRELLELAAKAAGLKNYRYCPAEDGLHACIEFDDEDDCTVVWMPHLYDGDALRLAVELKIDIHQRITEPRVAAIAAMQSPKIENVADEKQRLAATRRAIVRAAAEIGKAMQ